jgi:hypothetical protein
LSGTIIHYGSCAGWESGDMDDCDCFDPRPWRIRKEPEEQFPWRVWRRTDDWSYEPLMRCSSWHGAMELVHQFICLRERALLREPNV